MTRPSGSLFHRRMPDGRNEKVLVSVWQYGTKICLFLAQNHKEGF